MPWRCFDFLSLRPVELDLHDPQCGMFPLVFQVLFLRCEGIVDRCFYVHKKLWLLRVGEFRKLQSDKSKVE